MAKKKKGYQCFWESLFRHLPKIIEAIAKFYLAIIN